MQVIQVTANAIFSAAFTVPMVMELAVSPFVGYTQDAAEKLAAQQLAKGSAKRGAKSTASGDLPAAKLRTCIVNKLQNNPDINATFAEANGFAFEFNCLEDLDMGNAGANKAKRNTGAGSNNRATKQDLAGAYVVLKQGVKCTAETDAGKWEIWQHVWACNSFEEFFSKAPAKAVTKTQRVITARSEILWAIKSGWIKAATAA